MITVYDIVGEVLEKNLSIFKVKLVLSDNFILNVSDMSNLTIDMDECFYLNSIPIYKHDIQRALYLKKLIEKDFFRRYEDRVKLIDYVDSLSVIYEWIGYYLPIHKRSELQVIYNSFLTKINTTSNMSICLNRYTKDELKGLFITINEVFKAHRSYYQTNY